jgi:hypothetical protein
MTLLGAGRKDRQSPPEPSTIGSRLLGEVLHTERLEALDTLNILDFGRANSGSLELFNQFSCRLCVLDAADSLLHWSGSVAKRAVKDEPPSQQQLQHELSGLLGAMGDTRFDVVFLWDTLNHLHELALPAFSSLLRRHLTTKSRGHGFILHKRDTEQRMRRMGLGGLTEIRLLEESDTVLFPHTRKAVNEALGPDLQIDHAVLHSDGRLECVLTAGAA